MRRTCDCVQALRVDLEYNEFLNRASSGCINIRASVLTRAKQWKLSEIMPGYWLAKCIFWFLIDIPRIIVITNLRRHNTGNSYSAVAWHSETDVILVILLNLKVEYHSPLFNLITCAFITNWLIAYNHMVTIGLTRQRPNKFSRTLIMPFCSEQL